MATALAYQQPARRHREQEQPLRQPLRVLPGRRTETEAQPGLLPIWRAVFIIGIMAALVTGVVWVARVGLVNATMELLADSAQMSRAIESEISEGSRLEVQYAFATSPAAIQEAASTQLGMVPDQQVEYLRVTPRD